MAVGARGLCAEKLQKQHNLTHSSQLDTFISILMPCPRAEEAPFPEFDVCTAAAAANPEKHNKNFPTVFFRGGFYFRW